MTRLLYCLLTGYQLDQPVVIDETLGPVVEYQFSPVGKVKISLPTLMEFMNNREYHHPILAGICRNAFEHGVEPPLISRDFLDNGIKIIPYPKTFKEKVHHLLKYMYEKGGKDFKSFTFITSNDYPICFCENHDEFRKVMEHLKDRYFIKCQNEKTVARGVKRYYKVELTDGGIEEIEKDLPKIPMIGLVNQKISTGDSETDDKINHAKDLFFQEPQTLDRMRSACEALIFVLEPLRQDLKKYFITKDIEDFFQLVNNFDIRHNKAHTKAIEHPEQLEWIFYSLLNTINAYTKLKQRLE
jgi:hypothetical protein